jgi:hypothetical protein
MDCKQIASAIRKYKTVSLFIDGALIGPALDLIHVYSNTLTYPQPFWPTGQAWWVWLIFGLANIAFSHLYKRFGNNNMNSQDQWTNFAILVSCYFITAIFPVVAMPVLLTIYIGRILIIDGYINIKFAIIVAFIGCIAEESMIICGMFRYTEYNNIPLWLFCLYLNASPFIVEMVMA